MTRTNLYISLYGILPLKRKQKWVNRTLREGGKQRQLSHGGHGRERKSSFLPGPGKARPGETEHSERPSGISSGTALHPILQGRRARPVPKGTAS